ncbi:MAG: hypothetical protein KY475_15720 [Planctomycetes bacterium]|nr:hypothetical protein [Planctomycetota bacterium]
MGVALSALGIRQEPRGFAIAGLAIGIVGMLAYAVMIVVYGAALAALIGFGAVLGPRLQTEQAIINARERISRYYEHNGVYPSTEDWRNMVSRQEDGWNNPLRYTPHDADYEVRSAGPDGHFDTADDITDQDVRGSRVTSPKNPRHGD